MWPNYLRRAAATGTDALGDALVRTGAAVILALSLLGVVLVQGGAGLFFGVLALLTFPVALWPRLFGLVSGNLMIVVGLLVFVTAGNLPTALSMLPLFAIAVFFMMPHIAGEFAMNHVPALPAAPPPAPVEPVRAPAIAPALPAETTPPPGPTPPA